jgi:L-threonylcarbamoyladenylate synthase
VLLISTTCASDFFEIGRNVLQGKTIVFPTDTVYGLGSSPFSQSGINRCYQLKKRETGKKMPVLLSSSAEAARIVKLNDLAKLIAEKFWPGQLTLVLPILDTRIPRELLGSNNTLAVRVPDHECCLRLIAACGNSLIGTSANISGLPPFINPSDSGLVDFAEGADYFVLGECGGSKLASTVLDLSEDDTVSVLREGAIPSEMISDYLSKTNSTDFSFNTVTS